LPIMVFRFFRNKAHLIFQTGAAAAAWNIWKIDQPRCFVNVCIFSS
jgi:hypothetical protein